VHRLQLPEVPPSHLIPPGWQGNGAATGECGEQCGGVVPQVKQLLLPPLHRSEHGNDEIGIDSMPKLEMNNCTQRRLAPHLDPTDVGCERNSSTGRTQGQPHKVMKAAICRTPRGSECAALGHSTIATSRGTNVRAHRSPAHKRPQRSPIICP
jgi:hypothetical protein